MKILVVDQFGEMTDWCWRAADEGCDIKWYVKDDERTKEIGRGMAPIVRDYKPHVKWADLIILAENTKYLREADVWREDKMVVGATQASALWELNREIGQKVFEDHAIKCLPYKIFTNYDEAIAYVKKEKRRFVSKPSGDEPDKSLSYVSKSAADMVYMLERWKSLGKLKTPFMLQEFVGGIEMAVGAWFGPGGFNQGWCENFEFKKLMNDDMGCATGEQGTVLRYAEDSRLADEVLAPLEDAIAATGHTGYIDVNCIIDEDGTPWPLEFTCRNGYPTFNIQMALHKGSVVEWLSDLACGVDSRQTILNKVAVGVVMTIPDYPYSRLTGKQVNGVPIYGITNNNVNSLSPCQMQVGKAPCEIDGKIVDKPCLVTAGDYVLVAHGTGDTVREAKRSAYSVLDDIETPNSPMWRTDIGDRLKKQIPDLKAMGYCSDWEY